MRRKIQGVLKKKFLIESDINPSEDPVYFLDLWIMNKFNVLPTDIRYMNLFEEQKISIFKGINMLPLLEETSKGFKINKKIKSIMDKKPEELVSPGVIKRMKDMFKEQGLGDIEIKNQIRKQCQRIKETHIKNLENE